MLYMPATTAATPLMVQETPVTTQLASTSRYFMLQSAPIVPAVPVLNTTYVYPRYGFVPKPVETSVSKEEIERTQPTAQLLDVTPSVQHVVHHHYPSYGHQTCAGYCELCCPWIDQSQHHHHQPSRRQSRRDEYERDEFDRTETNPGETIDEKIERIRRELRDSTQQQRDHSTETVEHHVHHYPRPRSSSTGHRSASAGREPWRSTNQNDYPWRDSHLPAYRQATIARSQTPVNESRTWHETAHDRSHRNTDGSNTYYNRKEYVYRPKSETEAKKHYTQTTGKDADREVCQALRGGTTTYEYRGTPTYKCHQGTSYGYTDACTPTYKCHQGTSYGYTDACTSTSTSTGKVHHLRKIDSTNHHDLYASNHSSLHVIPKQGSTMDPPYMRIMNAPVTYIH